MHVCFQGRCLWSVLFFYKSSNESSIYLIYILTEHIFIQLMLDHDVSPFLVNYSCVIFFITDGKKGLNLNFNPAPYVLMPRWRVGVVPVVQRTSVYSQSARRHIL